MNKVIDLVVSQRLFVEPTQNKILYIKIALFSQLVKREYKQLYNSKGCRVICTNESRGFSLTKNLFG